MAFKMKAGKEGPMKKNFPSVFKKDLPQVTVKDKEARKLVLKKGYMEKDGKYFEKPMDPSFAPKQVSKSEAVRVKRKSQVKTDKSISGADASPAKMKKSPMKANGEGGSSKIDQQIKQAQAKLDAFYKIDFNEERDNPKSKYRYYRAEDINSLEGSLRDKIKKLKNKKKSQGVGPGYTSSKAIKGK
tara:strand:- start:495 stop:1052 length:558 start_codon:yes stop_codon:yes gene_type:complete